MTDQTGGLKKLVLLFLPIVLITFSNSLFLFIEKIFLARISTQAMEAAVNATYSCQIFQAPCVALAMMAQVFVGRWLGAGQLKNIGPGLWQFIWFSLLSTLITFPFGYLYGNFFFNNTGISPIVFPYYYSLLAINFIYPLGTALSCFYLGMGKTRLILIGSIGSQALKLFLAYFLIFGFEKIGLPSFGMLGGVFSTLIAQGGFCLLLFFAFINRKNSKAYFTREWKFQPSLFWECINPGILRAFNRILNFTSWAAIAHLMMIKGGDHLLMLSIGGTLFVFLPFLGDAICQAQTTVVSQIIGSKNYSLLNKAFNSGTILSIITAAVLIIPLILFPYQTFYYLFPDISLEMQNVRVLFFGVWLTFIFSTWSFVPISYILAFKDMKFSLFMGLLSWINGFLFMYMAVDIFDIPANQFWLVLSIMHAFNAALYYWRMNTLQNQLNYQSSPLSHNAQ